MRTFLARRVNGRWFVDGASVSKFVAMPWSGVVPTGDWAGYVTLHNGEVVELLDDAGNPLGVNNESKSNCIGN